MVMLNVKDLECRYGSQTVIHSVNLQVDRGAVLSLVGPNGAGKSTLLKCINGLLQPSRGTVEIEGKPIQARSRMDLAKTVAYVPQSESLRLPITVFDTILLGRRPYVNWRPKQEDLDIVQSAIEQLELGDLALRDLNQLSGGERQKVIIAKAIVQEPKVLLFDEPSTYLDLKYQLKTMQLIRDLVDEKRLCAVIVTHDLNLALRFSDQLAVLHAGTIAISGGPDLLTEEVIRQVYEVRAHVRQEEAKPFVVPLNAI